MVEQPVKIVPSYIWNGTYSTWDAACEAAKSMCTGGGDGGARWLKRITEQLLGYRTEFKQYGVAFSPRPTNLPLVCAMTTPGSIVDFGGSSGWCWDYLQNSLPESNITSYRVVETVEVVNYMTKSGLHSAPVEFICQDNLVNTCDLLYCNSILQYFGSNAPLISIIERTNPQYILLEDLVAMGEEDFFTVQTHYDSGIPYRFLGLSKLLSDLLILGYVELVKWPYLSPVLGVIKPFQMDNFPQNKQLRYSLSILLQKSKV